METEVPGYVSFLYGRRTGQILLRSLKSGDIPDYIGNVIHAVGLYAVFGGTPVYVMEIDRNHDIFHNIQKKILTFDASLARDGEFVLCMEL